MKKKKKLAATTLGAVFALSTFGSAFAAEVPTQIIGSSEFVVEQVSKTVNFDEISKEDVLSIFNQAEAGTLTKEEAIKQLDEAFGTKEDKKLVSKPVNFEEISKEVVQAIFNQAEAGTLTKEEAIKQLNEALGIKEDKNKVSGPVSKPANFDEISKEDVISIFNQSEAGTLKKEEAIKQLNEALGIKEDKKPVSKPANFDEISKEEILSIFNQAEAGTLKKEEAIKQLNEALGIKEDKNKVSGPVSKPANFDEISKEDVLSIFNQAEAGTLTKEKAIKQLNEALGIKEDKNKVSGPVSKPANFD
ncbi:hypothetical protein ACQKII_10405 [Lysinibacillus sp. NPDC048646]|uniref:hypothetical protein n=1 Tax=Lysinibacillus sp. NPDC048646 TaxID=3390574 RepID=UPI003CFCEBD4